MREDNDVVKKNARQRQQRYWPFRLPSLPNEMPTIEKTKFRFL
jgi:hypothetical protein